MAGVSIQFDPTVFDVGKPLERFAASKHLARYSINPRFESKPHIAHKVWFTGKGYPEPPNSVTLTVQWGGPSWFETIDAFNRLPYSEIRAKIAKAVEHGILQVLTATGGATATGTITAVAKANLIDGETVVLITAAAAAITFHFDVSGTYVPGGGYDASNIRVNVSGDTTADDVATTLAAAIDGTVFTAPAPAANVVTVTQTAAGANGNSTIIETVADIGFITSGFSGGGAATAATIRAGTVA